MAMFSSPEFKRKAMWQRHEFKDSAYKGRAAERPGSKVGAGGFPARAEQSC